MTVTFQCKDKTKNRTRLLKSRSACYHWSYRFDLTLIVPPFSLYHAAALQASSAQQCREHGDGKADKFSPKFLIFHSIFTFHFSLFTFSLFTFDLRSTSVTTLQSSRKHGFALAAPSVHFCSLAAQPIGQATTVICDRPVNFEEKIPPSSNFSNYYLPLFCICCNFVGTKLKIYDYNEKSPPHSANPSRHPCRRAVAALPRNKFGGGYKPFLNVVEPPLLGQHHAGLTTPVPLRRVLWSSSPT